MGSRIIQIPGSNTPPLQHLNEFVEEDDTAIVHHPLVIPSDFYISRRSAHFNPYFTKSEVRVKGQKVSQNPMNIGEKRFILCVFTPDSGIEKASTKQTANGDFAQQIMPAILSSGRVQILKQYGDRAIVSGAPITRPGVLVEIEAGGNDAKNLFLRSTEQPAPKPRSI